MHVRREPRRAPGKIFLKKVHFPFTPKNVPIHPTFFLLFLVFYKFLVSSNTFFVFYTIWALPGPLPQNRAPGAAYPSGPDTASHRLCVYEIDL